MNRDLFDKAQRALQYGAEQTGAFGAKRPVKPSTNLGRMLYWLNITRSGGMPVEFTGADGAKFRTRWTRMHGIKIGSWFFGAVKREPDKG